MAETSTGRLEAKFDEKEITSTFRTREFVIEVQKDKWSDFIKFQLKNDNCTLIDAFNLGEQIEVSFNIKGLKWVKDGVVKGYFNTLDAWRIKKTSSSPEPQQIPPTFTNANTAVAQPAFAPTNGAKAGDQLPF